MDSAASLSCCFAVGNVEGNLDTVAFLGLRVVLFGHDGESNSEVLAFVYGKIRLFVRAKEYVVTNGIQGVNVVVKDSQFDHVVTPYYLYMQEFRLAATIR